MPRGSFAYRRTLEFLSRGKLHLKNSIKVMTVRYNPVAPSSAGLRFFLGEHVPQIQYKNPKVQILPMKEVSGFPHIKLYFDNGHKVMIDCENKESYKILSELSSVAGKLESQVKREQAASEINPANFGDARKGRFCICEVPGQVPCPKVTPIQNVEHKWHEKKTS